MGYWGGEGCKKLIKNLNGKYQLQQQFPERIFCFVLFFLGGGGGGWEVGQTKTTLVVGVQISTRKTNSGGHICFLVTNYL